MINPVVLRNLQSRLDGLSVLTGRMTAWLCFLMMALTCLVVLLRYAFSINMTAIQESIVYLHGMVFMIGIAWTLKDQGHVRVDIFYHRFGKRRRALIDLFGTLLFLLPFSIFVFWTSLDYVSFSWSMKESSSEPGGLPGVYLLKTLIPVMAFLLIAQGVSELLQQVLNLLPSDRKS